MQIRLEKYIEEKEKEFTIIHWTRIQFEILHVGVYVFYLRI